MKVENGIEQLKEEAIALLLAIFDEGSASSYSKPLLQLRQDFFDSEAFKACSTREVSDVIYGVDKATTIFREMEEKINKIKAAQSFLQTSEN